MKTKYLILAFVNIILVACHAQSQVYEQTKSITHSFPLTKQSNVKLTNKYGDIMVTNWEKDSVAITVIIKATDKKESDALNKLNSIDANFTTTPYYIDIQTVFKDNKSALNATISEFTSGIFNSKRSVSIDYSIMLPEWANLEVNNKYGNVYTARHTGNFTLNLSNGDFKGSELLGESNVTVSFGNITLNTISSAKLDIGYSDMTVKQGGKIILDSRSSKFWFTTVQSLDINSRRDKLNIDTLAILNGQFDFSTIQLSMLSDLMALKTNYGDLKVGHVGETLRNISLNSQYTDIIIGIPAGLFLALKADYKKTAVTLPASFGDIKPQLIDEKNQQFIINGIVGSALSPNTNIQLNTVSGSVVFVNY